MLILRRKGENFLRGLSFLWPVHARKTSDVNRSGIGLLAGCCFLAAVLVGCSKKTPASDRVLRLSQRNEPADLDPATATLPDEFFVIRALSEGLVTPDMSAPNGVRPSVASHWETSADGLTITFHLRPETRWSDGSPVTAADFIGSYRRLLTPATAAPKAALFFAVKNARAFAEGRLTDFSAVGFAAPDPLTLVVTLDRPSPSFLLYAASGPWLPVHLATVTAHGREWTKPAYFVGNGPFILAEWRPQQRIVVKKNPFYRTAAAVRLDAIEFLRFDSGETEERAYRAGQIDVTMDVPKTKIATYARERPTELHRAPLAETRFLSFNTTRPPLNDERVRRALSLALDRKQIVERVLLGGQEPAVRFIPPALLGNPNPPTGPSNPAIPLYNAAEARRLLADAGFPGGKNFPRLELTGWSNNPILEALQAMWRQELGIDVAVAVHEAKVHLAALHDGTYDIAFATTLLDVADATAALEDFTSGASNNFSHWRSAEFDRLMTAVANDRDAGSRAVTRTQAETLLLAAAPIAPLYFNTRNWLMSARFSGWKEDALWTRDYTGISLSSPDAK